MAAKNSLIVDDSKSARVVLKRMLEELGLEVETVESADEAIVYLRKHRPDVIFMDHNMPGMDGFEAVKLIKNNSRTAVIPIMMYTSRGGEVYLSQARALGAVGIIPKTISHVGLKESLFKLGLIEDRRQPVSRKDKPAANNQMRRSTDYEPLEKTGEYTKYLNDLGRLMDDQTIELHKSMWLGVEAVSNEIYNRLNSELEERFRKLEVTPAETPGKRPVYLLAVLLLFSLLFNVLLLVNHNTLEDRLLAMETESLASEASSDDSIDDEVVIEEASQLSDIPALPDDQQARDAFIKWAQDRVIEYPYDELALNDNRLHEIDELINKAAESGYSGSITLQTHVGRFCLNRDSNGEYILAEESIPAIQCEFTGNHVQPIDLPSTHQSRSFANYLSDMNIPGDRNIEIDVVSEARTTEISRYPVLNPDTTAKQWNTAAQANNIITVKLSPLPGLNTPELQPTYLESFGKP